MRRARTKVGLAVQPSLPRRTLLAHQMLNRSCMLEILASFTSTAEARTLIHAATG